MRRFQRYIGIDYSGAGTAASRQKGLRCFMSADRGLPTEYRDLKAANTGTWSRDTLYQWLLEQLQDGPATAVGLDHAFSLTHGYFESHGLKSWTALLEHFVPRWEISGTKATVGKRHKARSDDFYQEKDRAQHPLRRTETWTPSARSVYDFKGQGTVAYSTHAGMVYLHQLQHALGEAVHIWPFDGWQVPPGVHAVFEVYPSMFRRRYDREMTGLETTDQKDAYAIARWLSQVDDADHWDRYLDPVWPAELKPIAECEGWILGVA